MTVPDRLTDNGPADDPPLLMRVVLGLSLILIASVIGVGGIVGGLALAPLLVGSLAGADPVGPLVATFYTTAIFAPIAIASMLAAWLVPGAAIGMGRKPIGGLVTGLAMGGAGLVLSASLAGLAGTVVRGPSPSAPALILMAGGGVTLMQAGAEEMLLRGLVQPALARQWGRWAAVIGAALLFMALHLVGGARGALEVLNLVLAGLLFGVLALRTGGIVAPIAAHWAWNCSETLLLGLSPNPGVGDFGSLIDLDLRGAAMWGGSGDGLNASIAVTLVLIALTLPLLLWRPARPSPDDAQPGMPATIDVQWLDDQRLAWLVGKADDGGVGDPKG